MLIYLGLVLLGIVKGFINTLAGGGSTLAIPVLLALPGFDSTSAISTNRVAILAQNFAGTRRFHKYGKLQVKPVMHIVISAVAGAILGVSLFKNMSAEIYDIILAVVLVLLMIDMLRPKKKGKHKNLPKWLEVLIFFAVGFYGGFIQVGVGFVLLTTLTWIEDFDLIRANAIKLFIILSYSIFVVAYLAFFTNKIVWQYGLLLALGNVIGTEIGVKLAIKKGEKLVKVVIFIAMTIATFELLGLRKFITSLL